MGQKGIVPSGASLVSTPAGPASFNSHFPPKAGRSNRSVPVGGSSFSSVKERVGTVAQNFSDTSVSSLVSDEVVIDDEPGRPIGAKQAAELLDPRSTVLQVGSYLRPCQGFRGWKQITVRGKVASKSFGDLTSLKMGLQWEDQTDKKSKVMEVLGVDRDGSGGVEYDKVKKSTIEGLPMEILSNIIDQLHIELPPNGFSTRNADLMSLLLTSRTLHSVTLATLYSNVTIPHSRIFRKFLSHIKEYPALGTIVRRLDFSHFNPTIAGMSARERKETLNLIPATLLQCLDLTPNLQEFLAQEHIDDDVNSEVLQKLLCGLPKLRALDLCACSGSFFQDAFTDIAEAYRSRLPNIILITRLSLHECTSLPSSVFESLIPRLPGLTHLDVAHTRITDTALLSLPTSAKLTHLNLSKCSRITGDGVFEFVSQHDAAQNLVYINLAMDAKSNEMLGSHDLVKLIPRLPDTLKSLNLKGSKMDSTHMSLLLPITQHLEELGLGRHLSLFDLTRLVFANLENSTTPTHTLRYLDISDLSPAELDLGTLFGSGHPLLQSVSMPLEVIELSSDVFKLLKKSAAVKRVGWCLKEAGRRGWLVRDKGRNGVWEEHRDNGARDWKWGAIYWGMRKVPVAKCEVGGMYGHYMFKR